MMMVRGVGGYTYLTLLRQPHSALHKKPMETYLTTIALLLSAKMLKSELHKTAHHNSDGMTQILFYTMLECG